jgi:hypothetical protein
MKNGFHIGIALSLLTLAANAQIEITNYNVTYTQDFNLLAITLTSNSLPPGWSFSETGTSANVDGLYRAGTGSNTAGDTYSLGATSSTERALGSLLSGTISSKIGAHFINNGSETLTGINLQFRGEQWRLGDTGRNDRLDFQYSTDATSLTTGTWTDANALDFIAPISGGTVGALNGNTPANSATISSSITGLNVGPGSSLWIRWMEFDAPNGSDDALGIDDVSIAYVTIPEPTIGSAALFGAVLFSRRRRRRE